MNAVGTSSAATAGRGAQNRPAITATAMIRFLPNPAQPQLAPARCDERMSVIVMTPCCRALPIGPSLRPNETLLVTFECIPAETGPRRPRRDCFAAGKPGSHTARQVRDVSRVDAVSDEQSLNDRVRQGVAHPAGDPFASRYLVAIVLMHRMLLAQGLE